MTIEQSGANPMNEGAPRHRDWISLVPITAGLCWLLSIHGFGGFIVALLPGGLLLASGVSLLLWPGESKVTQYMALGGVLGVLLGIPGLFAIGTVPALVCIALSVATFLVAGKASLRAAPLPLTVPAPPDTVAVWAKAALDEALIAYFVAVATIPEGQPAARMCDDAAKLDAILKARGWHDDPAAFHRTPSAPEDARLEETRGVGRSFQRLTFSSAFVPDAELPGAAEWSGHLNNRQCSARVFRQPEAGRPWLLCIHGYRMGVDFMDLRLFAPHILQGKLRLNLVMPILPLHGPRRAGWQSGDKFLDGDLLDLLHAESQALWDLRRTVAWIRNQDPSARIGVLGYSLGGYNASLLAAHEPSLDFVVAGIPLADFASALWRHIPGPQREYFAHHGLDQERYRSLLRVVSPLACAPQLPAERLHLFAGSADRLVTPDQPLRIAAHWNRSVEWFGGGHLTFRGEGSVVRCIQNAMTGAGWDIAH
jgi:hypothetical protein